MQGIVNADLQIKFWGTTVGRDKTSRTVQYLSRFLAFYYMSQGAPKETVSRFSSMKSSISLSRKCTFFCIPHHLRTRLPYWQVY